MSILAFLSTQVIDTTTVGRAVMTAVDAAAARTAIGAQPLDADLTALAALTGTNNIYYRSAADTWTSVTIGTGLTFTGGTLAASAGAAITSLNGLTGATQTFAVGTAGTNFAISSVGTAHTFNLPDAGATARGVVTTGSQTFAGTKTFAGQVAVGGVTGQPVNASLCIPQFAWVSFGSTNIFTSDGSNIRLNNVAVNQCSQFTFGSSNDLALERDGADILAQRRGTNAQTTRIYNTWTSATSFERLNIAWATNVCTIGTEAGSGGGTLRGLRIGSANTSLLAFWGATPIVQPTTAIAAATRVGGGGTALTDTDTFDGYTLAQIVKALRNIGALA